MTNLTRTCCYILRQLYKVVDEIRPADYTQPSVSLSGSSIGQHLRHTIEFFFCFQHGFETGLVNYDKRAHDKVIETDKREALNAINQIMVFIERLDTDAQLLLEVSYDLKNQDINTLDTNASRELVYNIEHAVHHMAIMKIGLREIAPYVKIASDFGIAASTVRYQQTSQPLQ